MKSTFSITPILAPEFTQLFFPFLTYDDLDPRVHLILAFISKGWKFIGNRLEGKANGLFIQCEMLKCIQ